MGQTATWIATAALVTSAPPAAATFENVTSSVGSFARLPTWGAQAVDIDGDADVDLLRNFHYYRTRIQTNDGNGLFTVHEIPQIATGPGDRHGFLFADLDLDGVLDAMCAHGGSGGCGCSDDGNELWRGLGGGEFEFLEETGVFADPVGRGRCFSAGDVDGDGDLDLYLGKAPLAASANSLFRNDGEMTFVDVGLELGLDDHGGTTGALFADYDDDGDPDLFVGGEEFRRRTVLFRNDDGIFVDVTVETLGSLPTISGADWGDFDNDGDLDLAICEGHEGIFDAWGLENDEKTLWFFAHHRFAEDGRDVFVFDTPGEDPEAELQALGVAENDLVFLGPKGVHPTIGFGEGGVDGQIDGSHRRILLTDEYVGAPRFEPGVDHGIYVWRLDPGGSWVVFVSAPPATFGNFSGRITSSGGILNAQAFNLEGIRLSPFSARVFRNEGGTFREVTHDLGITASVNPRGVKWIDFDNDGDLDLHQMNKGTSAIGNERDVLWRNDGEVFTPLEGPDGVPGPRNYLTDGGVWADFDRDGDLDLFLQEGAPPNFWTLKAAALYYRNEGPAGHWLSVDVGTTIFGGTTVGTKLTAHAGPMRVHRRIEANAWRGFQGPLSAHFGLGEATLVDSLVVVAPSGERLVFGPLEVDQALCVSENGRIAGAGGPRLRSGAAAGLVIGSVFPQPASGRQEISLSAPAVRSLAISIFDVRGRRVRTLVDGAHPGGALRVVWDGRDGGGRPVPSGVYFLRSEGDLRFERKLVRIR